MANRRSLTLQVINYWAKKGCNSIVVDVDKDRRNAIKLYKNIGFISHKEDKDSYRLIYQL